MAEKAMVNGTSALRVITIEAAEKPQEVKLRVAAYARVSSSSEDQKNSFEAQLRYYDALISGKENWTMVDLYADEGITGTSTEKRKDFQRLLSDCRKGKIDRVLTKSVSRFARNTKECLEAIRELKQLGVGILFEEQNIDTSQVSGEMLTAVFAAIAQAESESISANMRWSYQKRMQAGSFIPPSLSYGYRRENGRITIDPPAAKVVQKIFGDYLAGSSMEEIAAELKQLRPEHPELGEKSWCFHTVSYILQNEKYTGDSLWQKTYHTDTFPVKKHINWGEKPSYFAEETHPAIIGREIFRQVQKLVSWRSLGKPRTRTTDSPIPCPVVCGQCGGRLRRKKIKGRTYRCCRNHDKDGTVCSLHQIPEEEIEKAFLRLWYKLKHHPEPLLQMEDSLQIIRSRRMLWSLDVVALNKQIAGLSSQDRMLAQLKQQGLIDPDIFISQQSRLAEQIRAAKQEKAKLLDRSEDTALRDTQDLLDILESGPDFLDAFDRDLFGELVERVIVESSERVRFRLKNGLELAESIERTVR